jgi:hypothetical protein
MQLTINVPDNLPKIRITQRIKELEQSLQDEATFFTTALTIKKAKQDKLAMLTKITHDCASLPTLDDRLPDEILGYSDSPEGLWGHE